MTIFEKLYDFQKDDVLKLQNQRAALIANEMGTGKTFEAIARDELIRQAAPNPDSHKPTLVIAPLSVVPSWAHTIREHTDLKVHVINAKRRLASWNDFVSGHMADADVVVVHWEGMRLLVDDLKTFTFSHIIADECHRASNKDTRQTLALKALVSDYRTGLSGTPADDKAQKLWSILDWLWPKGDGNPDNDRLYSSYWRFFHTFTDSEKNPFTGYWETKGPKNVEQLHDMLRPYFIRHLKKKQCCEHHPQGVLPFLPDKMYSELWVDLTPKQETIYKDMKKNMLVWLGEHQDQPLAAPVVVAQLTRLQQFACAYATVNSANQLTLCDPSSKLDALMELIADAGDEQIVVFSQFAQLIKLLNARLKKAGISYVSIIGEVPAALRGGMVDKFQSGEKRIFTGTIGAGGEGITLTAASTVVFLDRAWSPAMNMQAEDRLHRIGQKNTVNVIDIRATGTVDLGRKQNLELKAEWIAKLLGDDLGTE